MALEKVELVSRSEKLTSERDRLIKERTSAEKQLRETELKLKGGTDKVDCTALIMLTVVSEDTNSILTQIVFFGYYNN